MLTWIIVASVGSIGCWFLLRRQPVARGLRASRNCSRAVDPHAQAARLSPVWQLQSNGCTCGHARAFAGKRLALEEVRPLIETGRACRCYYRPLADQRRAPRRQADDRRAALRFDLSKTDRRNGDRRKAGAIWERTLGY